MNERMDGRRERGRKEVISDFVLGPYKLVNNTFFFLPANFDCRWIQDVVAIMIYVCVAY